MVPSRGEMRAQLIERHGREKYELFAASTVAICGLGGLGSNIAVTLARAGIGKLILIDFDTVDVSNLHRQQYKAAQVGRLKTDALRENLSEIAPYTTLETHNERITPENFERLLSASDVVCEAFDNAESKAMLINCVAEKFPQKYLVAASGMAGFGDANDIKTRKITSHFYLCGDGVSDVERCEGLVSSRVMLCAAHQAHAVLQILSKKEGI